MSRRSKITRSLFLLSALTAAYGPAAVRPAHAAAYTYPARQRTVNAGVLFVGTAGSTAPDPAPYVFYVLDQRADIKPVGWTFVNPIAPTSFTPAINARWGTAYTTPSVPPAVSPNLAAYWEVPLRDVSSDQLQQFDVLYLPATGQSFTPADNEKLRRFVDSGGQLIVEYTAVGGTNPLFAGTNWGTASGTTYQATGPVGGPFDLEPILTQPYFYLPTDITTLQTSNPTGLSGGISGIGGSDFGNLFNTVLTNGTNSAVSAAQFGAGEIVASSLSLGPVASVTSSAFFSTNTAPNSPLTVPNATLQMLSNIISWADTHPTENKTSHQNAAGPSAASFAPSFSYPDPGAKTPLAGTNPPPGAAVWGNFIYVTDSTGVLHCFDAYPDKDLLGQGQGDNSAPSFPPDFSVGRPYDEIWNANVGKNASGPTVGAFGQNTYVFVEKANGSVVWFNSITGASAGGFTSPSANAYPLPAVPNAPAPTYYDGRVYAGQADGTLLVHDMNSGASASGAAGVAVPLETNVTGEYVTAAPAVGLIGGTDNSNTVVATVATNANLYTVLLGGRNDPLLAYTVNNQLLGYNVNRASRYFIPNIFVDLASVPAPTAFDSGGGTSTLAVNGQDPVFNLTTYGDYYANWDIDFSKSLASGSNSTLSLNEIKSLSLQSAGFADTMSAPAFDRSGDCYYTVNSGGYSYLFGVHPDIQQRGVRVKFRFRIPATGDDKLYADPSNNFWTYKDADGVDYTALKDFHFVGAPVVDGQGNVYIAAQNGTQVAAQNGTQAAVLCFNGNQQPTADALVGYDTTQASYSQPDEGASNQINPIIAIPSSNPAAARYGQLNAAGNHISVFNFGRLGKQVLNNLSEPQPFLTTPNGNQVGASAVAQNLQFHTNLSWFKAFTVKGPISGLSKAGNTLMLVENAPAFTILDKFPANPTVGTGKVASVTPAQTAVGTGAGGVNLSLGDVLHPVLAAPSAGGSAMVINGPYGIAAFNQQLTLIADNNRILEADADGNAVWSADATTRDTGGGTTALTTTKVDFAHPTALTQVAPNDYLVADTGNNRCVRFDRAGKVLWELTRFNDPNGLMAPGQPASLSQPTSVEINPFPDPVANPVQYKDANNIVQTGSRKYYLVADTGNDRVLEIADLLDSSGRNILYKDNSGNLNNTGNGTSQDHILTWISHTADQYGRRYQYASASYFYITGATIPTQIAAIVTNTRLGPVLANGALSAANADTSGGSIVTFNRPPAPLAFNLANPNDLNYVATSFQIGTAPNGKTYQVHNPRFLNVFTPPPPNLTPTVPRSYLYADDNGAFDLAYNSGTNLLTSTGLAFTSVEYKGMGTITTTPQANSSGVPNRAVIPFVPTCVQRINNDNTFQPRYLITQSYGQAELGTPLPGPTSFAKIGGEIFEVDVDQTNTATYNNYPVGGFGPGATLSRPGGTSPLTQPTSAIRTPQ